MCAIAGILSASHHPAQTDALLLRMLSQGQRRGPDAEGVWRDECYSVGQRQLHIMQSPDSTHSTLQPFVFKEKFVLSWNGSIYNYIELRKELQSQGCMFSSETDTEVLAQGLFCYGLEFLSRINGIFALSWYDTVKRKLTLAVDRFGVKPLHYQVQSNTIYFASEIKQLVVANNPAPHFNTLVNFLLFNAENYSAQTAFEKAFALRGGQYIEVDFQNIKIEVKQWHLNQWSQSLVSHSFEENVLRFEELSANALMLQSRNAVKQGIALSAGLDSSWLLHGLKNRNSVVNAFTVGVTGDSQDERSRAKKIFEALAGPEDHFTAVAFKSDELIAELDDLSYVQEEPFTDPSVYMQFRMMKIASQQGVRVMLSGQGADELLLGYERYSLLESLPLSIINKLRYFEKLKENTNASFAKFLIFQQMFAKAKLRTARVKHLHRGMFEDKLQLASNAIWESEANSYSSLPALYANEIELLHLPKLLRYEDRNGGAFGIEGRQPFLENQLADFMIQLPQEHKLKDAQTKRILRSALGKACLMEVANQKTKIGFASPDHLWQNAHGEMDALIKNSRILKELYRTLPNYKANPRLMWKLQAIARWEKMYNL